MFEDSQKKNKQEKTLDSKFYHDLLKSLMIGLILAGVIKLMEKQGFNLMF